jgi:predicted RNA-binding Zn ribbon-like protein
MCYTFDMKSSATSTERTGPSLSSNVRPDRGRTFGFATGRLCLWLAATVGERGGEAFDRLQTPDDLSRWCGQAKLVDTPPQVMETDLEATRKLREAIYRTGLARRAGAAPEPEDRGIINFWAAQPPLIPQLSKDGRICSWTASHPMSAILASIARDAVELFASPEAERLKMCARTACASLFLDTSHPRQRRWCSMNTCGNRAKKMAYRGRNTKS